MLVKVQGSRPENILFMVHEVFEGLIAESFHGVTYDYLVPCGDCLKVVGVPAGLWFIHISILRNQLNN